MVTNLKIATTTVNADKKQVHKLDSFDLMNIINLQRHLNVTNVQRVTAVEYAKRLFEKTENYFVVTKIVGVKRWNEFIGIKSQYKKLELYEGDVDRYISTSSFVSKYKKNKHSKLRTQSNIKDIISLTLDLDFYKFDLNQDQAIEILGQLIQSKKIELPHFITFSGNGIQLIYLTDNIFAKKDSKTFKLWQAIHLKLMDILADLNPDPVTKSPSNVIRLPNTVNGKNGKVVRTYLLREDRLSLNYLKQKYFPGFIPRNNHDSKDKRPKTISKYKKTKNYGVHTNKSLNEARMTDIFTIIDWKQEKGVSLKGCRSDMALNLRFLKLLLTDGDKKQAEEIVKTLWGMLTDEQKENTSLEELLSRSKYAEDYYEDYIADHVRDNYKRAGYFPSNETLIAKWDVPLELQINLKTIKNKYLGADETGRKIVSKDYERCRRNAINRKNGVKARSDYLLDLSKATQTNLLEIQKIINEKPNISNAEIAKIMGKSSARICQLLKILKSTPIS